MSDLIRRSDVKALFHQGDEKTFPFSSPGLVTEQDVDSIPAVDAVEVRHGRWVESDPEEPIVFAGHTYYPPRHCSVCGRTALDEPWTYCPNCGARMDGCRSKLLSQNTR